MSDEDLNATRERERSAEEASSQSESSGKVDGEKESPSIDTASVGPESAPAAGVVSPTAEAAAAVSADQERQILLLMLLAQVCSLHDPTPKAFVIHVIELFERGLLDRESIRFLFELGLVPSPTSPSHSLLIKNAFSGTDFCDGESTITSDDLVKNSTALATTLASGPAARADSDTLSAEERRSIEASSIRSRLAEQYDNDCVQDSSDDTRPWDVSHFPLSLSRYQREFSEVRMLASGSFGSVFHAVRKLDGCDYAVKKVSFNAIGYSNKAIQQVIREVQCLASVSDHPNVVTYYTSWLEPGWMTGQAASNIPQHQLLTDLQQLMQPPTNSTDGEEKGGSSYMTGGFSSAGMHRRGFSLDASIETVEESWADQRGRGRHCDDSYLQSSNNQTISPTKGVKKEQSYKYQVSLFIQMQLCHPATLADWIRERNKRIRECDHERRIGGAILIFSQLVSGLAHIHDKKIVHRDLKPANVFATTDGKVIKIGDFGLSKQLLNVQEPAPAESSPVDKKKGRKSFWEDAACGANNAIVTVPYTTQQNALILHPRGKATPLTAGIGTASYASPEQVKSKRYSLSADVFSLGLIFLELVCCFETEHERLHNFQRCRNQQLPALLLDTYPKVAEVILSCTKHDARERPTAQALVMIMADIRPVGGDDDSDLITLKQQLHDSEREVEKQKSALEDKDNVIESMRLELERLRAGGHK